MMTPGRYERCGICDEWGYGGKHQCPPIWECRVFETKYENDWQEVYAVDAERAAEKFAEDYDCHGDYDIVKRGCEEIEVRKAGSADIMMVDISAESRPHYYGSVREA